MVVPIGIMLNSLDRDFFKALALAQQLGFPVIHTAALPEPWLTGPECDRVSAALKASGLEVATMFVGFAGQSYADIPTIARTVGLVQSEYRRHRLEVAKRYLPLARGVGAPSVTLHLGFLPDRRESPDYVGTVAALRELCDAAHQYELGVNLETGQEPASRLLTVIRDVDRANLGVNFDPGNFLLYGTDDPHAALELLFPLVRGVHCKDGKRPAQAGTLGEETPLGSGDVDIRRLVRRALALGYRGPLVIEREQGSGLQEIIAAREFLAMISISNE